MAKVKKKYKVTTMVEAEAAMQELNDIHAAFAKSGADEAEAIRKVRQAFMVKRYRASFSAHEETAGALTRALKAFAKKDQVNWIRKFITTPHGMFGFHRTPPKVALIKKVSKNFGEVIDAIGLLGKNMKSFLRVETNLDKDAILVAYRKKGKKDGVTDVELEAAGLKVTQADDFKIVTTATKDLEDAAKKLKAVA